MTQTTPARNTPPDGVTPQKNLASSPCGLSAPEAAQRLANEGANMLPGSAPKSTTAIVREVVTEPMFLMLLAAG